MSTITNSIADFELHVRDSGAGAAEIDAGALADVGRVTLLAHLASAA